MTLPMSKKSDLTIAIPSYKRPELLAATLQRLMNAPWTSEVQFLALINQPSTGYEEALAPFLDKPNLRTIMQREHRSAWQQCCALGCEVDTDFILHVSDDDWIDTKAVEIYLETLRDNPGIIGAFAPIAFVNDHDEVQFLYNGVKEISVIQRGDFVGLLRFLSENEHWPELGIFRSESIRQVNAHHDHINSALLQLGQLLFQGAVLFGQKPFYRLNFRHDSTDHHLGHKLPMEPEYLESTLYSLDLLIAHARRQVPEEQLSAELEFEIMQRARRLHASRLMESFHSMRNVGNHAGAMSMKKRLEAYGMQPSPESKISHEIASLSLAQDILGAMSWLDYLVVYRIAPLVTFAQKRGQTNTVSAESLEECLPYRENAIFLCFEAHRSELEGAIPPKRIRTFESLTGPFRI